MSFTIMAFLYIPMRTTYGESEEHNPLITSVVDFPFSVPCKVTQPTFNRVLLNK